MGITETLVWSANNFFWGGLSWEMRWPKSVCQVLFTDLFAFQTMHSSFYSYMHRPPFCISCCIIWLSIYKEILEVFRALVLLFLSIFNQQLSLPVHSIDILYLLSKWTLHLGKIALYIKSAAYCVHIDLKRGGECWLFLKIFFFKEPTSSTHLLITSSQYLLLFIHIA